jgi:hypothetical protein
LRMFRCFLARPGPRLRGLMSGGAATVCADARHVGHDHPKGTGRSRSPMAVRSRRQRRRARWRSRAAASAAPRAGREGRGSTLSRSCPATTVRILRGKIVGHLQALGPAVADDVSAGGRVSGVRPCTRPT